MPDRRAPQVALELGDQLEVALGLLVRRIRGEEVSRIGKAVGADRPQVRQPQQAAEVLAHVAARGTVRQRDAEAHAARDQRDYLRHRSEEPTSEIQSLMRT